jgi:hypothetical protein
MSIQEAQRIARLEERVTKLETIVARLVQSAANESLRPAIQETQATPSPLIGVIRETLGLPKRG